MKCPEHGEGAFRFPTRDEIVSSDVGEVVDRDGDKFPRKEVESQKFDDFIFFVPVKKPARRKVE